MAGAPVASDHIFYSPRVSSTRSYYLLFEGDYLFKVGKLQYLDFFNRIP